jgi:predicted pyridoxine 5'-phosphate oxidase superfamily flavin-nucleotide-binding protein
MGRVYNAIDDSLREFIQSQQMFFVATAPLSGDGLINLSPKGLDSLRVLDDHTVAYADLTGSGIETVAHLRENGRVVLMFCAFEGPPKIVRLHGRGDVIEPADDEFTHFQSLFPNYISLRSVIRIRCDRISDSCGWSVPRYDFQEQRSQLSDWAEKQGVEGVVDYQRSNNATSLDGFPGLRLGE